MEYYNKTAYDILEKEIGLILPTYCYIMLCHLQDQYDNRIYLIMNSVQTLNSPLYFHYLLASYQEMACTHSKSKGSDVHTFRMQTKGIQLNFDTS